MSDEDIVLCCDIGNSRCKCTKWQKDSGFVMCAVSPAGRLLELAAALRGWAETPSAILMIGGDDHQKDLLTALCLDLWKLRPCALAVTDFPQSPVHSLYNTAELGADRYFALVGARCIGERECVVVDCGTCVTIDILNAGGTHLGGIIVPGLCSLSKAYPCSLPSVSLVSPVGYMQHTWELADATQQAMSVGGRAFYLQGIKGLAEGFAHHFAGDTEMSILCTGGDGILFSQLFSQKQWRYYPNLVAQGMVHAVLNSQVAELVKLKAH